MSDMDKIYNVEVQLGPWGAGYGVLVVPGADEEESVEAGNRLIAKVLQF